MPVILFYFLGSLIWEVYITLGAITFFLLDKNVFLALLGDLLAIVNNFWLTGGIEEEETFSGKEKQKEKWNRKEVKGSDLSF